MRNASSAPARSPFAHRMSPSVIWSFSGSMPSSRAISSIALEPKQRGRSDTIARSGRRPRSRYAAEDRRARPLHARACAGSIAIARSSSSTALPNSLMRCITLASTQCASASPGSTPSRAWSTAPADHLPRSVSLSPLVRDTEARLQRDGATIGLRGIVEFPAHAAHCRDCSTHPRIAAGARPPWRSSPPPLRARPGPAARCRGCCTPARNRGAARSRARSSHRSRRLARVAQRVAEIVVRLRIVRPQPHRAPVVRDCIVEPAAFAQHVAQVIEVRRVRPRDERLLHQRDARVVLLQLAREQPEEMQRVRLARLRGEDRVVQRLRFGETPRLVMRQRGLQRVVNIVHASCSEFV